MTSLTHFGDGPSDALPGRDSGSSDDPTPRRPKLLRSEDIFLGENEVLIQLGEEVYRLRRTRNGKLILTK